MFLNHNVKMNNIAISISIFIIILIFVSGAAGSAYCKSPDESSKEFTGEESGSSSETYTAEVNIKGPVTGFETDYISKYVWYGIPLSDGAVAQSCLWLENRGYTYMIYGNYDLSRREFDQYNLYFSKAFQMGVFETEMAVQSYTYPTAEDSPATREFIMTLTRPYRNFDLYLSQSWDIQTYKGSYVADLGIAFEREAGRGSFKSSFYLEYGSRIFNEVNLELSKPAIDMAGAEISYTYTRKDGYYIRPHAEYSLAIDRDLKEIIEKPDTLSYGIAVGKYF